MNTGLSIKRSMKISRNSLKDGIDPPFALNLIGKFQPVVTEEQIDSLIFRLTGPDTVAFFVLTTWSIHGVILTLSSQGYSRGVDGQQVGVSPSASTEGVLD